MRNNSGLLGEKIKQLRIERNLTQKQLCTLIGVSESSVSKYELGTQTPPPETIKSLARVFKTNTDYLLDFDKRNPIYIDDLPESKQQLILGIIDKIRIEYEESKK